MSNTLYRVPSEVDGRVGVLSRERHGRLIDKLEDVAHRAGLAPEDIYSPCFRLSPTEEAWLTNYRRLATKAIFGAVYVGDQWEPPVPMRCRAIAACLIRGSVRARLRSVAEIAAMSYDDDLYFDGCLFVPELFVSVPETPSMRDQLRFNVMDKLQQRAVRRLPTVIGVADFDHFSAFVGRTKAQTIAQDLGMRFDLRFTMSLKQETGKREVAPGNRTRGLSGGAF